VQGESTGNGGAKEAQMEKEITQINMKDRVGLGMTNTDEIRKRLKQFITEVFLVGDENEKLSDSESFMQTGIIDSTGVLELASFIEQEYKFSIDDDEMTPGNLDSVNNLVSFISRKLA
jgi:acyl carrier protein